MLANEQCHKNLLEELHNTYCIKNKKYGNSFKVSIDEWGFSALGIRVTDKYLRMKGLLQNSNLFENNADESLRDTLMDMANYCVMGVMSLDEEKQKRGKDGQN